MQRLMIRLDGFVRRHRRAVIAAWLVALLAAVPLALRQSENLTGGGFGVPGSQSLAVDEALERDYPDQASGTLGAVVVPRQGATPQRTRAAIDAVAEAVAKTGDVALAADARSQALRAAQENPARPILVPLKLSVDDLDAADVASDLREHLGIGQESVASQPVTTHLIGQGALWASLQDLSQHDLERAEATGFPIVALILLLVFGSLAAAALPLALGLFSVLITGALIYLLSLALEMSVFVTNMASMIGIGVAVDYSLFVLARYREEVRAGRTPDEARAAALATSGVAVLFSGVTVIVSLAGLFMVPTTALQSMALGAILVVAVSMLASATLLPALISLLGHRAYARGRIFTVAQLALRTWRRRRPGSTSPDAPPRPSFWDRWTARVMRRPVTAIVAAATVLLVIAAPLVDLTTGNGALRQFPADHETPQGFAAAAKLGGGPGDSSPLRVIVPAGQADRARTVIAADRGVERVSQPRRAEAGDTALLVAIPRHDGESQAAKDTVVRLREALPAAQVGGSPASQEDFRQKVAGSMWKIVLFVLALSLIVLTVLLRSVVLPVKAVLMNLLSVGAAYGVLVVVFQWGWFDGFMGFESAGYVDTITPPLILAVVFGLSMDYEIFLLSRIRERYAATGDTRRAVAEGLASSARTITSAALIMVCVFLVFVGTGVPSIKQLGLGNAVAIAVDATLVRLVLVPAAMELLGKWNWWVPRRLERLLPDTSVEELGPGMLPAPAAR